MAENTSSKINHRFSATAFVSAVVVVGFYVTLWMAMSLPPERPLGEVLASLIGALSMAFGAVVNYYLGSSIGSTHKTELLSKSNTQLSPASPTN